MILILFVVGCGGPTRFFRDQTATRVTVDGSVFDVRVRGELAEAIRQNPQYAPRLGPIGGRAAFAMTKVSGCKVASILGDQAVILGLLDCNGRPRTWGTVYVPQYSCLQVGEWHSVGSAPPYSEFDCDPY